MPIQLLSFQISIFINVEHSMIDLYETCSSFGTLTPAVRAKLCNTLTVGLKALLASVNSVIQAKVVPCLFVCVPCVGYVSLLFRGVYQNGAAFGGGCDDKGDGPAAALFLTRNSIKLYCWLLSLLVEAAENNSNSSATLLVPVGKKKACHYSWCCFEMIVSNDFCRLQGGRAKKYDVGNVGVEVFDWSVLKPRIVVLLCDVCANIGLSQLWPMGALEEGVYSSECTRFVVWRRCV